MVALVLPSGALDMNTGSGKPREASWWFASGLAVLLILVAASFGKTRTFEGPILDDDHALVLNPHIGSFSASSLRWVLESDFPHNPRFMPAGWLGIDFETRFTGLNPFRLHAYVLILHGLNAAILACVLRRLVLRAGSAGPFRSVLAPLAGAAFYAIHPMRAEALGWESLVFWHQAVLFALGWAWIRLGAEPRPAAECAAYIGSVLSFPAFLGLAPAAAAVD